MSKEQLKSIFKQISDADLWSLQLVKITNTVQGGISYYTREILLKPIGKLNDLIIQLSEYYLSEDGIDKYDAVDDYSGDVIGSVIYRLSTTDGLIQEAWEKLKAATANPDTEEDIYGIKFSGYIISGTIRRPARDIKVKLVSMGSPTTVMTNKYIFNHPTKSFCEISDPVFTFRKKLDAIIVDETAYFFTMQAENLFNMERAHKKVCDKRVSQTVDSLKMTDPESFRKVATSGANIRRFVSFNDTRLKVLQDSETRKKYASMFNIKTVDDSIDTDDSRNAERLVKFLCNKAAIDPVENEPKEVSGMKRWA